MKSVLSTSMEATTVPCKDSSLHSTSFLKLAGVYLPSKPKHCRIKTDEFKPTQPDPTVSTSIDLKTKHIPSKNLKPGKKMSASETVLKKTRSQKNICTVGILKSASVSKPVPSQPKITIHRRLCTLESLQKLRSGLSTMNPEEAAQQYKSISKKINQKGQATGQQSIQSKLLTEYRQLTQKLFEVMGNLKKNHERQKINERQRHQQRQKKMVKKYQDLLQKNRHYSMFYNQIGKQMNVQAFIHQSKKHLKAIRRSDE